MCAPRVWTVHNSRGPQQFPVAFTAAAALPSIGVVLSTSKAARMTGERGVRVALLVSVATRLGERKGEGEGR